jgi:hypothetical protein
MKGIKELEKVKQIEKKFKGRKLKGNENKIKGKGK